MKPIISFQGSKGAYSQQACLHFFPDCDTLPCSTFEDAIQAVHDGKATYTVIPIENSVAGRVADVHHLLPNSNLYIIGEHFERIEHHLLAKPGAKLSDIKTVHSHIQALTQCRHFIKKIKASPIVHVDTAGAAYDVSQHTGNDSAAIASHLAGEIYNLVSLKGNIEDNKNNTTRFLLMGPDYTRPQASDQNVLTSLIFQTRNVPAALYKALGGFATNGINLLKIESYLVDGNFTAAQFYIDVEGHSEDQNFQHALEELDFFTSDYKILGVYKAAPYRQNSHL